MSTSIGGTYTNLSEKSTPNAAIRSLLRVKFRVNLRLMQENSFERGIKGPKEERRAVRAIMALAYTPINFSRVHGG